jgi:two-component system sensor histidine kinase PilS (NtrC family)
MQRALSLTPEAFWRSAKVLNTFRALLAFTLLFVNGLFHKQLFPDVPSSRQLTAVAAVYIGLTVLYWICLRVRWPRFQLLLSAQVASDIAFIVTLMQFAGGLHTGVGLLLLPYLAAAGLVSRGRTTLFHAALASIALLLLQAWGALTGSATVDFVQAALLSIACFATAWLAFRLASYATESEALAEKRGQALANLAQVNRLVLQDVSDGVLVLDEFGVVRQFNQRAEKLLGSGLVAGKTHLADYNPDLARAMTGWLAGDLPTIIDFDQGRQSVRPRFMPVRVGVAANGTVVFLEDVHRLRREAQQLKLAALGRLTANIAHEIRNPLSAITHAAQLLAEDTQDAASNRLTRIIMDNAKRLDRMVQEVLDLNRRDRAEPVDIRLYQWLKEFAVEFGNTEGLTVDVSLECPMGAVVRFDAAQLHQVLWNLCRNGWRFGSKHADSLRLSVARMNDAWVLDVNDDGPGVRPEDIAKLFEPFFTTDAKGTGLGLYIAREICAGNDSVLEYIPRPNGASFRITFPTRPA